MTEKAFWELINLINWKKLGNDDAVVRPLVNALAKLPHKEITAFDNILAKKLFALDTEAHARHMGGDYAFRGPDEFFSVDAFLYSRCAVVANGQETYKRILADPKEFPEDAEFEALLFVAATAYEKSTGKEYTQTTKVNFETYSNRKGWAKVKRTKPLKVRSSKSDPLRVPPWVLAPELLPSSPEWNIDNPKYYMPQWIMWFSVLPAKSKKAYITTFPEPRAWKGFYKRHQGKASKP
jgi:hypothetical protein